MTKPIRLLFVEDSEVAMELSLQSLRAGGFDPSSERVQSAAEMTEALAREQWDAVISDFRVSGFSGMDALGILRSSGTDIPFILVSGTIGEEAAVEAMRAGASDCLTKASLARLAPSMDRELEDARIRRDYRKTQRNLIENEAGLHRAQLMAKLAHIVTGPDGKFERWSETLPQLAGLRPDQLPRTTRAWLDILHPDDRSLFRSKALAASSSKLRTEFEYRLRRPDGNCIFVRQTMEPLKDDDEGVESASRWFNTLQDITAEKDAEECLRTSELRFRQIAESVGDMFVLRDADMSKTYYVSPAYERIWGYTCESLYANPGSWANSIHPNDRERVSRIHKAGRDTGFDYEFRIIRPGGEIRWVHVRGFPIMDLAGSPCRIAVIASDITERKHAAEKLERSESLKGAILESSLDCIITINHEGKVVEFNPAAEIAFGYSREYVIGKDMLSLVVPQRMREAYRHGVVNYLATGIGSILGRRLEMTAVRADGTEFPVELAVVAIGTTSTPMFTGFIRDITSRQDADAKIRRLNRVYEVRSKIDALIIRVSHRDELLKEACRITVEYGNIGMAFISELDPATLDVTPVAWAGIGADAHTAGLESTARADVAWGHGMVGRAIRDEKYVVSNDLEFEAGPGSPKRLEAIRRGYRSLVALPLIVEKTVWGVLMLYATERNFFNENELRLLTELAGDISFALENIGRQQKLDKLARIRAVSGQINAVIVRTPDRDELLRETCRIVETYGKFEFVWVAKADQERQKLELVASAGFSQQAAHALDWTAMSNAGGLMIEAIRTGKLAVLNDLRALPKGLLRFEASQRGCASGICLPLLVNDKVVAVIALFAPGLGFFDEEELALLNEVASNLSFALQAIDKQARIEYLAYYDVLTGLANRSLFLERVAQHIRSAAVSGRELALFMIDIERFKNINDSLGRVAGDELLQQVSEWLTRRLGDANLLARIGADRFAVVLPEMRRDGDVRHLLEGMVEAFMFHPFHLDDAIFRLAVKVGAVRYPTDGADADTLFRNAEAALKGAKLKGDRYVFYTHEMTERAAVRLTLENQLRRAIDNEEFVLHYQPKVSLPNLLLTGAEALIRWNDPKTGLVSPGRFIPVLEDTGLIHEVGRWALHKAIEDYLRWRSMGLPAVRIAVNVSSLQLRNPGFIAEIEQAVGIDPAAAAGLELELTESLVMEDIKHTIATLKPIRALGVTIAIDDFGTGFSSLSYLSKLPVDTLKIDRSFVEDMTAGAEGLALVSTIINLASSLKLKVVAEGVETEEQSRLLRLLKCDEMQGFLFCKPVAREIFEARYLRPAAT